jgi:hypothetical protein
MTIRSGLLATLLGTIVFLFSLWIWRTYYRRPDVCKPGDSYVDRSTGTTYYCNSSGEGWTDENKYLMRNTEALGQ